MERIPLVRPEIPPPHEWLPFYQTAIEEGQYSNFGPCHEAAERFLSQITQGWALPLTSGTAALRAALSVVTQPGNRVALPDFTFAATLQACYPARCNPVLFPADEQTWTIDPDLLWERRDEFDAFIVVSPFGYKVDFGFYDELAREMKKPVVYDCAGGFGMIANTKNPVVYSFHATKTLGIGEGGAIVFGREAEYERARAMINFDFDSQRWCRSPFGFNYKLDELRSAVLVAALQDDNRLHRRIAARKSLIDQYHSDLEGIVAPHSLHVGAAPQLPVLRVPGLVEELVLKGPQAGIDFRRYYYPLLSQMNFGGWGIRVVGQSSRYFEACLAFPADLRGDEYGRVLEFVKRVSRESRRG